MTYQIESGIGFVPSPKGRKDGSKNRNTANRDIAVERAGEYVNSGMTKIEAAKRIRDEMNLSIEPETIARLIK